MKYIGLFALALFLFISCDNSKKHQLVVHDVELMALRRDSVYIRDSIKIAPIENILNNNSFISDISSNEYISGYKVGENQIQGIYDGVKYIYNITVTPRHSTFPEIHKIVNQTKEFADEFLKKTPDSIYDNTASLLYKFNKYSITIHVEKNICASVTLDVDDELNLQLEPYLMERFQWSPLLSAKLSTTILLNNYTESNSDIIVVYNPELGLAFYYSNERNLKRL